MSQPGMNYPNQPSGGGQRGASGSIMEKLRRIKLKAVLGVLGAVALVIFIVQNTDDVPVSFLGWDWTLPLFLLFLITIGLSMICTWILSWYMERGRKRR